MLNSLVLNSSKQMLPKLTSSMPLIKSSLLKSTPVLVELSKRHIAFLKNYKGIHTDSKPVNNAVDFFKKREIDTIKWQNRLSNEEKSAISKYTNIDYELINSSLRKSIFLPPAQRDKIQKSTDLISSSLAKSQLSDDIIVYRTTTDDTFKNCVTNKLENLVDSVLLEKGFLSTSKDKEYFANVKGNILLRIKVPKGTKCADISGISLYKGEKEILIDKDQKLLVTGAEEVDGKTILDCEILQKPE